MTAAALLAVVLVAAAAAPMPAHIEAEYRISSLGLPIARTVETFERTGDGYRIESVTRSEGALKVFVDDTVTLVSEGRVGTQGLEPLRFEQRRERKPDGDIRATFDRKAGELVSVHRGETRRIPLPPDTQDRISVLYQFMNLGAPADEVRLPMSNGRKVDFYAYRKVGEERLSTPAGEFDTLHYARITDSPRENRVDLWLAKDRHMLPVRVQFDDPKGLRLDQELVSLRVR